ncbi:MAG: hypothetical protein SCAL_001377 [Candidatus Syntrophoarchaeum caldarius]|uniref:Uncharacterized protein n=1 Tax=Candidatus Syntropharchaeum caldarium TaxID=1838285 RepID=A0A1F2P802_9EURY|nr:MAG: hypothetical protein SCAL_001377 [Candidatus Syntrophoarchaeum caldarius]
MGNFIVLEERYGLIFIYDESGKGINKALVFLSKKKTRLEE